MRSLTAIMAQRSTREALVTFRRKISDFWIVADEVRKARAAGLAAGVI